MPIVRSPRRHGRRGQHRCDRQGKGTSVRPGSRSGAKTRDGSPGDLRDPTGVRVKQPELRAPGTQSPGREGPPTLQERYVNLGKADTKDRRITWAAEANKISDRRRASGKS